MNYSEIQTKVSDIINRPDITSYIAYAVNLAMRRIERDNNFDYMLKTSTSLTFTVGSRTITKPTDLKTPVYLYIEYSSTKTLLEYYTQDDIDFFDTNTSPSNAVPSRYAVRGDNILLDVPTDSAYSSQLVYYGFSTDLSADSDSNWLTTYGYDALIYATIIETAHYLKDAELLAIFETLYKRAIDGLCHADAKLRMPKQMERV